MNLKNFTIFILLFVLFNGCSNTKKSEPLLDKNIINEETEQIKAFYFVGKDKGKIGIYKYNFTDKKSSKFWFDKKEKVILLNYSPNLKHLYFLTAKYFGIRSTLPYIKRIKLYSIDLANEEVTFADTLINGTQINAGWIGNNSFKVIINSRDIRVSEYINKHTFIYNGTGKKLLSKIETINFIKDGYPLPVINNEIKTTYENFRLQHGTTDKDSLYLFDNKTNETKFIIKLNKLKLNEVYWNNNYLIFTTKDKDKRQSLTIYSLKDKKVIKSIGGKNIKNFLVFNNYLVYDLGLSFSSSISILNLEKSEITDSIKLNNNCGLKNAF